MRWAKDYAKALFSVGVSMNQIAILLRMGSVQVKRMVEA